MRRYWISGLNVEVSDFEITGEEFHHIFTVCRQQVGSRFEILTEGQKALFVEVTGLAKKSALVTVKEQREIAPLKKPHVHLALSVPKVDTFEKVLEKSVELGVHSVHPFFSDYSFVKSNKSLFQRKWERLQRIIVGATQQTGRGELMNLQGPCSMNQLIETYQDPAKKRAGVFAYEGDGKSLEDKLGAISAHSEGLEELWVFVGSEGGFSIGEVETFKHINLSPVSLGPQVLRVETACVTFLSIIKYELSLF